MHNTQAHFLRRRHIQTPSHTYSIHVHSKHKGYPVQE